MVDTAKAHADYQNHRQAEFYGEIGKRFVSSQRHAPATRTLHQGELSLQCQHLPNRLGQRRYSQLDTRLTGGQVWGDCRLEGQRVDLLVA